MNKIKGILIGILIANLGYSLYNWVADAPSPQVASQQEETAEAIDAAEGLDLKALTSLVKEVRGGQELERRLNEEGSINNLDLNEDDQVDYLTVAEFGDFETKIGYSLTTEPAQGEKQEVAEILIEKNNDKAEIQVKGNEQIYGHDAIFNDWSPIEREAAAAPAAVSAAAGAPPYYPSYFYPHPMWVSPFGFGYYPPFFSPFGVIAMSLYMNRMGGYSQTTVVRGANTHIANSPKQVQNPNQGKTANNGIKRSLKNPTQTQKQFQVANKSNLKGGGFGRSSAATSPTRPMSPGPGSGSRALTPSKPSSGGFGGFSRSPAPAPARGFGGSSSGSFRGGGFSGRSFGGFGK